MSDVECVVSFLTAFAESVVYGPPCSCHMPQDLLLSYYDIDMLMPHFINLTPRGPVLAKFLDDVGYVRAYGLLMECDPMIKLRVNVMWLTFVNYWLKYLARAGILRWGVLDDGTNNDPPIMFYLQENDDDDNTSNYGSTGSTIDVVSDSSQPDSD